MKTITLFDRNPDLCKAWWNVMADLQGITILTCELCDLPPHDYLVTAGNSYGIMTGGIDKKVRDLLGIQVQDAVQDYILMYGPVEVGGCVVVELPQDAPHGHLLYLPTMNRPRPAWPHQIVAAMAGALLTIEPDASIAIPGLGTGIGGLDPITAAKGMRAGIEIYRELRG